MGKDLRLWPAERQFKSAPSLCGFCLNGKEIAMTRDDLSEFLTQEENGWDLDNCIHETVGRIGELFFPPVLKGVAFAETQRRWRMYVYNLLAFLVADADAILAAHHFAQQKEDICKLLWRKLNLKITLKLSKPLDTPSKLWYNYITSNTTYLGGSHGKKESNSTQKSQFGVYPSNRRCSHLRDRVARPDSCN